MQIKSFFKSIVPAALGLLAAGMPQTASAKLTFLFQDDFEWLAPYAEASDAGDSVESDDPGADSPQIKAYTTSVNGVTALAALENRGYVFHRITTKTEGECIYLQKNYLKFGKTSYQAGISFKPTQNAAAGEDVFIEFDWCPQRQGSGKIDPTQLVVIVENQGESKQFEVPALNWEDNHKMEWVHASVALTDAKIDTQTTITIRNIDSQWGNSSALRYFLDNITLFTGHGVLITLSTNKFELEKGAKYQLTQSTTILGSLGNATHTWKSENPDIASVDENGLVTANSTGTTTISYVISTDTETFSASAEVTVTDISVGSSHTIGDFVYRVDSNEPPTLTATAYNGTAQHVEIPAEVSINGEKCTVTSLVYTFSDNTTVESVKIPNSVSRLERTFRNCSALTSVELPENLTKLGELVFYKCSAIKSIVLPESLTEIETWAFNRCTSLESIHIPESVTKIGWGTFSYNEALKSINLPAGLTSIPMDFLKSCTSLTGITIPESVTTIESGAFYKCTSFESISIPASVKEIGSRAFSRCTSLKSINVDAANKAYKSIDGVLFDSAVETLIAFPGGITGEYTVPQTVTGIYTFSFEGSLLDKIVLPEGLKTIGERAFISSNLTECTLPGSLENLDFVIFGNCKELKTLTINEGIETLPASLASGCTSLEEIYFGKSVKTFEEASFSGCTAIKKVFSRSEEPPVLEKGYENEITVFETLPEATVYVPVGTADAYRASDWSKFFTKFVETDFSGIEDITLPAGEGETIIYDLNGRRVIAPAAGKVYIVNGRKVLMK